MDSKTFLILALVASTIIPSTNGLQKEEEDGGNGLLGCCGLGLVAGAAIGATVAFVGAPAALGYVGFTVAGITKGSSAAWLMSTAATTGYGGAAVAIGQSVGAAGLSAVTTVTTVAGATIGGLVGSRACDCKKNKDD